MSAHTSPAPEETVFFEPFADLELTMGEEGRVVKAEAHAAIQMVPKHFVTIFLLKELQPAFLAARRSPRQL